jgi:hypothetical protein
MPSEGYGFKQTTTGYPGTLQTPEPDRGLGKIPRKIVLTA